jgi:4Fe-4S single cluster domain of Ferredoxin I
MAVIANPRNVPGDFYVEDGCCTSCEVIFDIAPGHFEFDPGSGECFVARQPSTDEETTRMVDAVHSAELRCVRYRGQEPSTLQALVAMGERNQCDALEPITEPRPAVRASILRWLPWKK